MLETNTPSCILEINVAKYSFGHLDFVHLILFRISNFDIRFFIFFRAMTPVHHGMFPKLTSFGYGSFTYHEKPGPGARSEIVELLQNLPFLVRIIHLKRHRPALLCKINPLQKGTNASSVPSSFEKPHHSQENEGADKGGKEVL